MSGDCKSNCNSPFAWMGNCMIWTVAATALIFAHRVYLGHPTLRQASIVAFKKCQNEQVVNLSKCAANVFNTENNRGKGFILNKYPDEISIKMPNGIAVLGVSAKIDCATPNKESGNMSCTEIVTFIPK